MKTRDRFWAWTVMAASFVGFLGACPCPVEARQRASLTDVPVTREANRIVLAAPAFEKKPAPHGNQPDYWDACIRPCDHPFLKVFGRTDSLLYGFDDYGSNPMPPELASLKSTVEKYLLRSPKIKEALAARRIARGIIASSIHGDDVEKKQDLEAVRSQAYRWVSMPLILLSRNPNLGVRSVGPACYPIPVAILGSDNQQHATDTFFILLEDVPAEKDKTPFSIARSAQNDTLDLVICHEMAHGIMCDAYGRAGKTRLRPVSGFRHSTELITDPTLAFTEGWAEAFEAFYGRGKREMNSLGERNSGVASILLQQQNPVRRERWLWLNGPEARDGRLKNSGQLMACEGVIATLFYEILGNSALVSPFEKSIQIMWNDRPATFRSFCDAWLKRFPNDRRVLLRIILEATRYATTDLQLPVLYQKWYAEKRKCQRNEVSREEARAAEEAYSKRKEEVFAAALAGADPFAAMFPELWLQVTYSFREKSSSGLQSRSLNVDLNTMDALQFEYLNLCSKTEAAKLIDRRDAGGGWSGEPLRVLKNALGERWGKLAGEGVTVKTMSRLPDEQRP